MSSFDALSPHWPEISALLDEALALPPQERAAWLASLAGAHAVFRDSLRGLLEMQASVETGSFMDTLPKVVVGARDGHSAEAHPGTLVGPYRLVRELGRGGMGAVWLAERADGQLKRRVALKLPHLAWTSALGDRLARERDILATLAHPNIARLYDAGVDQHGRPYFAMELVEGEPIDAYCRAHDLALAARIRLLLQVCDAVAHAHARLVVHRDLKPGNILVTADGEVRLLDFGIAKLMEGDRTEETALTQVSGRALTLDYASPEQIRGEPLGTASDVYSLGVVAYELLTGSRPYRLKRGSAAELEEAIASIDPAPASAAASDTAVKRQLRGDLDAILNKALKKASSERYPTIDALAQDLRRHLAHEPVLAQPDRWGYRIGKFVRRHRLQVAAGGLVAVALLGGAGVALWQAQEARAQADRAEEVKGFVLSIFRDADSNAGSGRKTTAIELLKQARARLSASSIEDPAIRAEVLTAVGYSLIGQGEHETAREVLQSALDLARQELGPRHPLSTEAAYALGEVLVLQDRTRDAAPLLDEAEREARRTGHMAVLANALRLKASSSSTEGRFDEGVARAREAVAIAEKHLTASHRQVLLDCYTTLAALLSIVRRPGSVEFAEKAYRLARDMHGARPTATVLSTRSLYGYSLIAEGRTTEGIAELRALLVQQVELLNPNHPDIGVSHQRIGLAALSLGDVRTGVESFEASLRIARASSGDRPTHDVALQRLNLGGALLSARRLGDAERELREAVALFAAVPGSNPAYARLAQADLAMVLARTDRLDEADAILGGLAGATFTHPLESAAIKMRLGTLRSLQGRHAEAIELLRDSAAFAASAPVHFRAIVMAALGAALFEAGDAPQALLALGEADGIYARTQTEGSPARAVGQTSLARAQLAVGQGAAALANHTAAVQFWRRFAPTGRDIGMARLWQAQALAAGGDAPAAREALREADDVLTRVGTARDRAQLARMRGELRVP